MRVVLKPAGILLLLGVIATLLWLVVSDQARLLFSPSGAPTSLADPKAAINAARKAQAGGGAGYVPPGAANTPVRSNTVFHPVDLTRFGVTDWVMYGAIPGAPPATNAVRHAGIKSPLIAAPEFVGLGATAVYADDVRPFRWTNAGGANASQEDIRTGLVTAGLGSGFRVTVTPTLGKKQTLRVWVGGAGVRSKLQARMSDGSPLSKVVESSNDIGMGGGLSFRSLYTIYFQAKKPNQKLILSYLVAEEGKGGTSEDQKKQLADANVSLQAIALD